MKTVLLDKKDYDQIKNGEEVLIAVETKGESPMYATISAYPHKSNTNDSSYVNAVFNGECD